LLPFAALGELRSAVPPTVRREIEFDRCRRRFNADELSWARQNPLDGVAQVITTFIEQNVWKRRIDALELGAHRQLRQFHLQLLRSNSVECASETHFAIFGDG